MRSLAVFFLISAGAYVAICALFYLQQDRLLFIGARPVTPPSDPRVQEIEHVVGGVRLRGVRVLAEEDDPVVLLYFGGNAEPAVANAASMLTLGSVTAYLIDYRGYGDSAGSPSETALRSDALAHFDWVRGQHPKSRVAILGRSLGRNKVNADTKGANRPGGRFPDGSHSKRPQGTQVLIFLD